ncbi:MAG: molybdopterin molybdotransferase MoeA [Candidatus Bathyarchaeia archaeon]
MVQFKGFKKLVPVETALEMLFDNLTFKSPETENVSIYDALNKVLALDVKADEDFPGFDRSAVDGYAVRAKDTLGATQFKPKILKLTLEDELREGEAKEVWTGNPLPKGADAVVMLENVKRLNGQIEVWAPVTPGENVSKRGEDVARGQVAVKAHTRLKPYHLGIIAALGINKVPVFRTPKVAVLATGNELVEPGQKPSAGQVVEVNRLILSMMCRELGAEPVDLGIARDDIEEISHKIKIGLEIADVVLTTGGTSVGALDLVPSAVDRIGKPGVIVHGVAMRPAMPTALAVVQNKPIVILSGNPVAAIFGFEVFARPLILKIMGLEHEPRPIVTAKLTRKVSTALGRKTFVRVRVFQQNGEILAEPISSRGSGIISTMVKANGYVVAPENREGLLEGEAVQVHLFNAFEV